jgi:hypothetical protein
MEQISVNDGVALLYGKGGNVDVDNDDCVGRLISGER